MKNSKSKTELELEHFPMRDRLHSDVLEKNYGPIHAEIIRHDDTREEQSSEEFPIREVHLCDKEGISKTYALTFLTYDPKNSEVYNIDSAVREEGMIGKTFRKHGYEIRKNVIDVFTVLLNSELTKKFHTEEKYAKARISEFYAKKDTDEPVIYGRVMELYAPDFRGPVISQTDIGQVNPSTEILEKNGISKQMVWNHLGSTSSTNADGWGEAYQRSKEQSLPEVFSWRERIRKYIARKD